jgi:hypothetical protein
MSDIKRTVVEALLKDWAGDLSPDEPEQPEQPTEEQELITELDEINSLGEQLERQLHVDPKKRRELSAHLQAKIINWQERKKAVAPPVDPDREKRIADTTEALSLELQKPSREVNKQRRKELSDALRKLVVGE